MAPRVRASATFPTAPEAVATDVLDEPFHSARATAIGGAATALESFDRAPGGELHIAMRQVLRRSALPAIARPFAISDLTLRRREQWTTGGSGLPSCRFTVAVAGAPLSAKGTVTLAAASSSGTAATDLVLEVSARITIPFVGRALQGIVVDVMQALVDEELQFAMDWFGERT